MEGTGTIVQSIMQAPPLTTVLLFITIFLLVFVLIKAVKKGEFSFNRAGIKLSSQDHERLVLQKEFDYLHNEIEEQVALMLREHPEFDTFRTKYIWKVIEANWFKALLINNIQDTDSYINARSETMIQLTRKRASVDFFFDPAFEEFCKKLTTEIVKRLIAIRKEEN